METPAYQQLIRQLHDRMRRHVPPGSVLLVISRGDPGMITYTHCTGRHFPHDAIGQYAGHHPADSAEALRALSSACQAGATHLLVPSTAFWWIEHYQSLDQHLASSATTLLSDDVCRLYDLRVSVPAELKGAELAEPQGWLQVGDLAQALLPAEARVALLTRPGEPVPQWPGLLVIPVIVLEDDDPRVAAAPCDAAVLRDLQSTGAQYVIVPRHRNGRVAISPRVASTVRRLCARVIEQQYLCDVYVLPARVPAGLAR